MFDSLETSRREQKHKKDKNTILNIPQITVLYCIIVSTVQYTIAIVSAKVILIPALVSEMSACFTQKFFSLRIICNMN